MKMQIIFFLFVMFLCMTMINIHVQATILEETSAIIQIMKGGKSEPEIRQSVSQARNLQAVITLFRSFRTVHPEAVDCMKDWRIRVDGICNNDELEKAFLEFNGAALNITTTHFRNLSIQICLEGRCESGICVCPQDSECDVLKREPQNLNRNCDTEIGKIIGNAHAMFCTEHWRIPIGRKCDLDATQEEIIFLISTVYKNDPESLQIIKAPLTKSFIKLLCFGQEVSSDCKDDICTCRNPPCPMFSPDINRNCDKEIKAAGFTIDNSDSRPRSGCQTTKISLSIILFVTIIGFLYNY